MKHIFTIHSPDYFFLHAVIFQEKLAHEDVIIINDGYKVPLNRQIVDSYQQQEKELKKLKILT